MFALKVLKPEFNNQNKRKKKLGVEVCATEETGGSLRLTGHQA